MTTGKLRFQKISSQESSSGTERCAFSPIKSQISSPVNFAWESFRYHRRQGIFDIFEDKLWP